MSLQNKTLKSNMELLTAALTRRKVSVWTRTADDVYVFLDDGGYIEKYTPYSVKINGEYYLRDECEFRVEP